MPEKIYKSHAHIVATMFGIPAIAVESGFVNSNALWKAANQMLKADGYKIEPILDRQGGLKVSKAA